MESPHARRSFGHRVFARANKLGVLSMAGTFPKSSWKTSQWFGEALGLRVTFGKSLYADPGYLGRDPRRRADDFNDAIRDDSVRAILLFRGGNSASEVLPHLDYRLVARKPKVIAGFSDHTSVINAVHAQTGLVTFLVPPMLDAALPPGTRNASVDSFRAQAMDGATGRPTPGLTGQVWEGGAVTGRLVAGNLAVLRNLLGTPYFPSLAGAVLAWEEVAESIQDLNMIFAHFGNSDPWGHLRGMVVGHLQGIPRRESGFTVRDVVRRHFPGPVLKTNAFGHFRPCFSLPLGVRARLDPDQGLSLLEQAVD